MVTEARDTTFRSLKLGDLAATDMQARVDFRLEEMNKITWRKEANGPQESLGAI